MMAAMVKVKGSGELLKIGEVARRTGVTLRTIRYYQSLGLIEAAQRSRGGLHLYRSEACDRIQFIRDLRSLNVPLAGIRQMLERRKTAQTGAEGARDVAAALTHSLTDVEKGLREYLVLRQEMTEALSVLEACLRCSARPLPEACRACENLTPRERVPVYIRALVN
jgi:DNA-binding transcriptional MerR regulator